METATKQMREQANNVESNLGGLVDELSTTISSLVESVRSNAGSLESELQSIRAGLADVREARPDAGAPNPVAVQEPVPSRSPSSRSPAVEEEPVVEEPEAVRSRAEELDAEEDVERRRARAGLAGSQSQSPSRS